MDYHQKNLQDKFEQNMDTAKSGFLEDIDKFRDKIIE